MSPYREAAPPPAPRARPPWRWRLRAKLDHLCRLVDRWAGQSREHDEGIPALVPNGIRLARRKAHARGERCDWYWCGIHREPPPPRPEAPPPLKRPPPSKRLAPPGKVWD